MTHAMWAAQALRAAAAPPASPETSIGCRGKGRSAGSGTERDRDLTPRVEIGCGRRQVEHDPADRDDDMDSELEQALAQPGDLASGRRRARGAEPEFLHQDVGGGGQEHAEL